MINARAPPAFYQKAHFTESIELSDCIGTVNHDEVIVGTERGAAAAAISGRCKQLRAPSIAAAATVFRLPSACCKLGARHRVGKLRFWQRAQTFCEEASTLVKSMSGGARQSHRQ